MTTVAAFLATLRLPSHTQTRPDDLDKALEYIGDPDTTPITELLEVVREHFPTTGLRSQVEAFAASGNLLAA